MIWIFLIPKCYTCGYGGPETSRELLEKTKCMLSNYTINYLRNPRGQRRKIFSLWWKNKPVNRFLAVGSMETWLFFYTFCFTVSIYINVLSIQHNFPLNSKQPLGLLLLKCFSLFLQTWETTSNEGKACISPPSYVTQRHTAAATTATTKSGDLGRTEVMLQHGCGSRGQKGDIF